MTWVIMEYLNNWRILIAAATIPVFLVIISLKWYPESARYYLVSNRHEEARKILERMAIMNGTQLPYGHLIEVSQCKRRGRFWDLLSKEYRKSTLLFWYIWLAVAFTYYGITLITPTIIQKGSLLASQDQNSTNFSYFDDLSQRVQCTQFTRQNYIDLLWSTAAEFPGLIIFTFLIEHCNRKVLLGASCAISGVLVFLLLLDTHKIVILLFLFGARAIILADFQLIFVMTTEAFPTSLRAIAMGSGSAFCRLGGMTIPYVAQVLVMENPIGAISLLGGSILLAAVATYYLPLETRGAEMKESHGVSNL
ncbi:Synaptic vesicle 2-related protein, partial [Stegodyphus mimosarum]